MAAQPISASEAHLMLPGNGLQSSHSDHNQRECTAGCQLQIVAEDVNMASPSPSSSFCHLVYGTQGAICPLNCAFNPPL